MPWAGNASAFCCPTCQHNLVVESEELVCPSCLHTYPTTDGIPDFYPITGEAEVFDEKDATWLDPQIAEARDTIYGCCTCELKGMAFCIQEIGRRIQPGSRILEVGLGTGHFTRWLAETISPGVQIAAFDISWPMLRIAQRNTRGLENVILFRANSRSALPFSPASFDAVLLRLAPLGLPGIPNVVAGLALLKPGGWYFEATWDRPQYDQNWIEWAIQHGYIEAEQHAWRYTRRITAEEAPRGFINPWGL